MKTKTIWRSAALGSGIGFLGVLTVAALFAWLVDREYMGQEYLSYGAAASLIAGGLLAGAAGGRGEGRWLTGGLASAGVAAGLLAVNLILFGGALEGLPASLLTLGGSAVAVMLVRGGKRRKTERKYQYRKYRTG